jgi:hypothetical protein
MPSEPTFYIFAGEANRDAICLESVAGLAKARERMETLAEQVPGKYFIFSSYSYKVLVKIDTIRNLVRSGEVIKLKTSA